MPILWAISSRGSPWSLRSARTSRQRAGKEAIAERSNCSSSSWQTCSATLEPGSETYGAPESSMGSKGTTPSRRYRSSARFRAVENRNDFTFVTPMVARARRIRINDSCTRSSISARFRNRACRNDRSAGSCGCTSCENQCAWSGVSMSPRSSLHPELLAMRGHTCQCHSPRAELRLTPRGCTSPRSGVDSWRPRVLIPCLTPFFCEAIEFTRHRFVLETGIGTGPLMPASTLTLLPSISAPP